MSAERLCRLHEIPQPMGGKNTHPSADFGCWNCMTMWNRAVGGHRCWSCGRFGIKTKGWNELLNKAREGGLYSTDSVFQPWWRGWSVTDTDRAVATV